MQLLLIQRSLPPPQTICFQEVEIQYLHSILGFYLCLFLVSESLCSYAYFTKSSTIFWFYITIQFSHHPLHEASQHLTEQGKPCIYPSLPSNHTFSAFPVLFCALVHWQIMYIFPCSLRAPQKSGIEKVHMNSHK